MQHAAKLYFSARRLSRAALCLLLLIASFACPAATAPEYQVKAVFLFNFTQFVEWPATAFGSSDSPLIIGILGQDPFGEYLDETVRGESANQHALQVKRYNRIEDVDTCHVLYVSASEAPRLQQIFARLKGKNVLTVGEFEGFATRGGVIRFTTVANKIRLRINLEAAKEANLTLSSKLLRPAEIVKGGEG